ncbi:lipopolysaccharide biosynthesis protein [Clostridium perfringens]|uniref:lipopolysaccharide biosynthesis protein n=1 Tax=Clostridium perfringens TaxID=1502 RepID=UPI002AC5F4EC|nr:oligosaccharide flippase family protein [Clostridium perfringens]MDZ5065938.1 oligosaccharide flippase family protein [Clostridium perfringens]
MNRTKIFLKNTIFNYLFRIIGIILGFFTIPITLNYLGDERFGIWQTMLTMISWAMLANFGIGNGLRNKVSECIADKNFSEIKNDISSAYINIFKISIIIIISMTILIVFINPNVLFKGNNINNTEIKVTFFIVALNFCVNFVIGLVNSIAYGIHKSYLVTIQQTINSFVTLLFIYLLNIFLKSNLICMAILYSVINIIANIILSMIIFKKNNYLMPSIKYDKSKVDNGMYRLGLKFFVLQIASLILISTDNFLVSYLISANDVTIYSIVNKLFMTINSVYSILLIQLWNSTTDAYHKNDYKWIEKSIVKLIILLIPIGLFMIIIAFKFNFITQIWLGRTFDFNNSLIWLMMIYVLILCWNGIFINVQNGMGKINIQIIAQIIAAIINIPIAILFVRFLDVGISGVVLANILSQSIIAILCPISVYTNLRKK